MGHWIFVRRMLFDPIVKKEARIKASFSCIYLSKLQKAGNYLLQYSLEFKMQSAKDSEVIRSEVIGR